MIARLCVLLLALGTAAPALAQDAPEASGYAAVRSAALHDAAFRQRHIRRLRLSIEELARDRDRVDIGGPIALSVVGGIALAIGGGLTIAMPIAVALGSTAASVTCGVVFAASCDTGGMPDWALATIGVSAAVALAGLVTLVYGLGERDRARARRRPFVDRVARERRELELLESIDLALSDRTALLSIGARF